MSLKHGILGLLSYCSMTGYDLTKLFNESLKFFWNAQTSQIYRELDALEKKKYVTSEQIIQRDKPNKRVFTITDIGKDELTRWLDEHSINDSMKIRDEMAMRVFFGSKGDLSKLKDELLEYKKAKEMFLIHLEKAEKELNEYEQSSGKEGEKIYWLMSIKRGYISAKGHIQWAEECLELLKERKGKN